MSLDPLDHFSTVTMFARDVIRGQGPVSTDGGTDLHHADIDE